MSNPAHSDPPSEFQGLIDSLRREAVEEAEAEAARILEAAERRAGELLGKARNEAEEIVAQARSDAEREQAATRDALQRAARDVLLSLESSLAARLDALLVRETAHALHGDLLDRAIRSLLAKWEPGENPAALEVLLSGEDLARLEEASLASLRESFEGEVVFRPVPDIDAGLRIGHEGEAVHYDFSAETIAEWMGRFLTPRMREHLHHAVAADGRDAGADEAGEA